MNKTDWLHLALRAIGLYILASFLGPFLAAISYVAYAFSNHPDPAFIPQPSHMWTPLVATTLLILICYLFLFKTRQVAAVIDKSAAREDTPMTRKDWLEVAVRFVGAYLLATWTTTFINFSSTIIVILSSSDRKVVAVNLIGIMPSFLAALAGMIFALIFLFKAKKIAALVERHDPQ